MQELIDRYELQPHPEGGHFRELFRSPQTVASPVHGQPRSALTAIHFLLGAGEVSRFHRVQHDEAWHFCEGAPLRLWQFADGRLSATTLGAGGVHLAVVPAGAWQAAESLGDCSLVSCFVAPGFDFADFSFLTRDSEDAGALLAADPQMSRFL